MKKKKTTISKSKEKNFKKNNEQPTPLEQKTTTLYKSPTQYIKHKIYKYYPTITLIVSIILILIIPIKATATGLGDIQPPAPTNISINVVMDRLINFALTSSVVVFLLVFLWACIDWITSGGEKGKLEQAKNRIIAALIGIIILGCIFAAMQIIKAISYDPYAPTPRPGEGGD